MKTSLKQENEKLQAKLEKAQEEINFLKTKAFRLSEQEMSFLLDDLRSGYWVWYPGAEAPIVGSSFARMLGYKESEIGECFWKKVIAPEDEKEVREEFQMFIESGSKESLELQIKFFHKAGHTVRVWNRGQVASWTDNGLPRRVVGSVIDISSILDSEVIYRESSKSLNLIVEGIDAGIWDANLETGETWWSDRFYKLLGYNRGELDLNSEALLSFMPDEDRVRMEKAMHQHFEMGKPYRAEFRLKCKDGSFRWMEGSGKAIFDSNGRPVRMAGSMVDISAKKQLELDLQKQNLMFKEAESIANLGAWEYDLKTGKIFWSDQLYRLHGLDDSYIPTYPSNLDNYVASSKQALEKAVDEAVKKARPYELELQMKTFQGEVIWVKAKGIPVVDDQGNVIGLRGIVQHIDDLKQQEMELRQKEFLLSEASRIALILAFSIMVHDMDNPVTVWSEEVYNIHEVDKDYEIKNSMEFYHPDSKEEIIKGLTELLENGKTFSTDVKINTAKGHEKWVKIEATVLKNEEGRVVEIPGFIQDIDESKRKELELKHTHEELDNQNFLFKEAEKLARIGAWEHDLVAEKVRWSDEIFRIFELPPDFKPQPGSKYPFVAPEFLDEVIEAQRQAVEEGVPYETTFSITTQKGNKRWVTSKGVPMKDKTGRVVKLNGVFLDITDSKIKEISLEQINHQLEMQRSALLEAEKMAKLGSWRVWLGGEKHEWSEQINSIHEIPGNVEMGFFELVNRFYEDRHQNIDKYWAQLKEGNSIDFETEIETYRGNKKWVRIKASAMRNEKKEVAGVAGTVQDITDIKSRQLELQKTSEIIGHQNKRLMDFTQIVSHNLRSHSSNIQTMLRFIEQNKKKEERETFLGYIKETANSLEAALNHLHDVIKIQNDTNPRKEKIDLEAAVRDVANILEGEIRMHEVKIVADLELKEVQYVRSYMDSILLNLVSNAIKYRKPREQPVIRIHSYTHKKTGTPILEVSDNGSGLDLKRMGKKLFGMYKTFHKHPEARGVGLFITKNQVEALGGKIEVESSPGKGSVFRVHM